MSLERYCRDRLIVLSADATAYEAARAMESNHIGSVVVQDKSGALGIVTDRDLALRIAGANLSADDILVYEVMSAAPVTLWIDDTEESALGLMRARGVRRLLVLDDDHVAGIVTLDDLILSGAATLDAVREVIRAQLRAGSPGKPKDALRPVRRGGRELPERRREARREHTLHTFAHRLMELLDVGNPDQALDAFDVVASSIVRRLMPGEAQAFTSQLPMLIRERLLDLPAGPDRRISWGLIVEEMGERLDCDQRRAEELVHRVASALHEFVSEGELADAASQLPVELKPLLQPAA